MNIIFQYAAKFVIGRSEGRVVAPGEYWTAINVHNPTNQRILFRKKIAIALPGEKPGRVSQWFQAKLGPDEALEIDREDIFGHAETNEKFLKGFVVIESKVELDIVTVYTAAAERQLIETLHTERVLPRRLEVGLPDLIPLPDAKGSFCRSEDNQILLVTVSNQGTGGAAASETEVDFGIYGKQVQFTPPLPPGTPVELSFSIPPKCFDPDCEFRITADVNNAVVESDKSNNVASGVCIG